MPTFTDIPDRYQYDTIPRAPCINYNTHKSRIVLFSYTNPSTTLPYSTQRTASHISLDNSISPDCDITTHVQLTSHFTWLERYASLYQYMWTPTFKSQAGHLEASLISSGIASKASRTILMSRPDYSLPHKPWCPRRTMSSKCVEATLSTSPGVHLGRRSYLGRQH
jgi:hypothetical protein